MFVLFLLLFLLLFPFRIVCIPSTGFRDFIFDILSLYVGGLLGSQSLAFAIIMT